MFGKKLQEQEIQTGSQQDIPAIRRCKREMEGAYLEHAWKKGYLELILDLITQKHEIGYMRDMLALTARLQIENGIIYPDEIKEWASEVWVQLPKPECGTWALDLNPLLAYDAIHWIRNHDSEIMFYEAKGALKRISDFYSELVELLQEE
ncbi:hypothetical protein CE91St36_20000 [Christensenellaceae bacterium]|uniref:hypothetical protein n=1 Tax=Christensenella timonensis TaxID=1816678 RepID=UPI00082E7342|nr:hypothetical protein [Christensenella timonensis]BDF59183.1 hypothetical protein CE91St36_20000 [Christensenellaceae bacterium]BDF61849.1 hypothetical protein CE91St37_19990 [Christensenellaceae bacterium]